MITVVVGAAGRCGLSINKGKSNVILYNYRGIQTERVEGIAVTNSVRYLETDLGNSRNCFNAYRKGRVALVGKDGKLYILIGRVIWF